MRHKLFYLVNLNSSTSKNTHRHWLNFGELTKEMEMKRITLDESWYASLFTYNIIIYITYIIQPTLYSSRNTIAFASICVCQLPDRPELEARLQEAGGSSPAVEVRRTRSLASGHRGQGGGRGHGPHHCTRLCHCAYLTIVPWLTLTPITNIPSD